MGEIVATFGGAEAVEQGAGPLPGRLNSPFGRVTEQRFELSEDLFNRVEIGGVGRQEAQRGPHPRKGRPHGRTLVAAQIVHNDDIARGEGRQQALFDIGQEAGAVERAIEDTRSGNTVVAQRGHQGQRVPVAVGPGRAQPLAPRTAAMRAGHISLGPGLIQEDEPARIKLALLALPPAAAAGDVRAVLLGGHQAFFLKLIPAPWKKRDSMLVSTRTPRSVHNRAAKAASVMSGCAATTASTQARCGATFEGRCPPVPALPARSGPVEVLEPLDRRRRTDSKPPGCRPPTQPPAFHGVNHTIPQILRIGSRHRLPPSAALSARPPQDAAQTPLIQPIPRRL